jgi:7-cyano-7-deazaguanine synthase
MTPAQPRAVVLVSGGLDSATALAIARDEGLALHAMTFRYGQRHEREVEAALRIGRSIGVAEQVVVDVDLRRWGGSALTSPAGVPKDRDLGGSDIPITYVPARNILFLAYALAWAETLGARDIFIGAHAVDYSGYPDCRPEFFEAFERMAEVGTRCGVEGKRPRIRAPLLRMGKAEIILTGHRLGVDFSLTHSCYDPGPDGRACGHCDSCRLRLKGFSDAGLQDPIPYI